MAETVGPEYARFIDEERRARRLPPAARAAAEGQVMQPVVLDSRRANELIRVAARRASGLFRPSKHTEVVWVDGSSELAVGVDALAVKLSSGLIRVIVPVRCDQTGPSKVQVLFAVGSPDEPAGLYAAASRRPAGPPAIVEAWGDALVAFAWQCLLGLVTGLAGATGKDQRGNLLVPVELSVTARAIAVVPMARHRFSGSTTLGKSNKAGTTP